MTTLCYSIIVSFNVTRTLHNLSFSWHYTSVILYTCHYDYFPFMSYASLSFSDVEEIPNEDEEAMMKMMGFSNFDSTKVVVIFNTPVVLT